MNFVIQSILFQLLLFAPLQSFLVRPLPVNNFPPIVVTPKGIIQGITETVLDRQVDAFLGIPYAQPPLGELRFRKANAIKGWSGIIRANKKPPPCYEYRYEFIKVPWLSREKEKEDCLYLNIWVPQTHRMPDHNITSSSSPSGLKTVMVWFYGGGFVHGSSDVDFYDGKIFSAYNDVIVITFNYRVGVFGFLKTTSTNPSGNIGLYDQVLVLQWIRETIEYFGGDPNNVVLFGESAGAISIGLHLLSPISKNLFRRAIMESASGAFPLLITNSSNRQKQLDKIVKSVGCLKNGTSLTTHPAETIKCLQSVPAEILSKAQKHVLDHGDNFIIVPNVGDQFLPANPFETLTRLDSFDDKELLIGANRDEGTFFLHYHAPKSFPNEEPKNVTLEEVKDLMRKYFGFMSAAQIKILSDLLLTQRNVSGFDNIRKVAAENLGDSFLTCPTVYFADRYSDAGKTVYYYLFDHRPSKAYFHEWFGVTHFEEVQFVFGLPLRYPDRYTTQEVELSKRMMQAWAQFAKTGTPSMSSDNIVWPPFHVRNPKYMKFGQSGKPVVEAATPHGGRCSLWELIYDYA